METNNTSISIKLLKIDNKLSIYNNLLKEHMKRTELLEKRLDILEKLHYKFSGALSLLSLLAIIATIVEIFVKIKP